jgi:hypothetical protein
MELAELACATATGSQRTAGARDGARRAENGEAGHDGGCRACVRAMATGASEHGEAGHDGARRGASATAAGRECGGGAAGFRAGGARARRLRAELGMDD